MEKRSSGMDTTTLIMGICAIVFSLLPLISGWFFALIWCVWIFLILAIIFGIIGLVKKQSVAKCVIGMVLAVLATFAVPAIFSKVYEKKANEMVNDAQRIVEKYGDDDFDWNSSDWD